MSRDPAQISLRADGGVALVTGCQLRRQQLQLVNFIQLINFTFTSYFLNSIQHAHAKLVMPTLCAISWNRMIQNSRARASRRGRGRVSEQARRQLCCDLIGNALQDELKERRTMHTRVFDSSVITQRQLGTAHAAW